MPLDRPRRVPIIQPDGQNDSDWLRYFDNLDLSGSSVASFESETRFQAGGEHSALQGSVRRLKNERRGSVFQGDPGHIDPRVKRLTAQVRELRFLEA